MKTTLKARLIQHLLAKKNDKGFTLVELLVVVIIIGILSAIALPSLLNQSNKAKESEGVQNVSAVNKQQTLQYTEKSQFSDNFNALALGTIEDGAKASKYFTYDLAVDNAAAFRNAYVVAIPGDAALKGTLGGVTAATIGGQSVLKDIVCKSQNANAPTAIADAAANITFDTANGTTADTCTDPGYDRL